MSEATPPLPQYALMAWCSVKAQGQIYLYPYPYLFDRRMCGPHSRSEFGGEEKDSFLSLSTLIMWLILKIVTKINRNYL